MLTKKELQIHLSARINSLRKEKSLTQDKLAKVARVARTSITELENNNFMPTLYMAYKLALVFGIMLEELISFD